MHLRLLRWFFLAVSIFVFSLCSPTSFNGQSGTKKNNPVSKKGSPSPFGPTVNATEIVSSTAPDPCAGVKSKSDTTPLNSILLYSPQGGGGPSPGAQLLGQTFTTLGFKAQHVTKIENATSDPVDACTLYTNYGQIWMFLPCKETDNVPSMNAESFAAVKGFYNAGGALVVFTDANYGNAGSPHCLSAALTGEPPANFGDSNDIRNISSLLGITLKSDLDYMKVSHKFDAEIVENFNNRHGTSHSSVADVIDASHPLSALTTKLGHVWEQYITDAPKEWTYLKSWNSNWYQLDVTEKPGVAGVIEKPLSSHVTQMALVFASTFAYEGLQPSGPNAAEVFGEIAKYIRDKQSPSGGLGLTGQEALAPSLDDLNSSDQTRVAAALKRYAATDVTVAQLWKFFESDSPLIRELARNAACLNPANLDTSVSMLVNSFRKQIADKKASGYFEVETQCAKALTSSGLSSAKKSEVQQVLVEYLQADIKVDKPELLEALFLYDKFIAVSMVEKVMGPLNAQAKAFAKSVFNTHVQSLASLSKEMIETFNAWSFGELVDAMEE